MTLLEFPSLEFPWNSLCMLNPKFKIKIVPNKYMPSPKAQVKTECSNGFIFNGKFNKVK